MAPPHHHYPQGGSTRIYVDENGYPVSASQQPPDGSGAAATWVDWHQSMRDGKEWAWGPTQVMWRLDAVVRMVEGARDLHRRHVRTHDGFTEVWCGECQQDWPCPTIKALPSLAGDDDEPSHKTASEASQ